MANEPFFSSFAVRYLSCVKRQNTANLVCTCLELQIAGQTYRAGSVIVGVRVGVWSICTMAK